MCVDEFTTAVENYFINNSDWNELEQEAEEQKKDIYEAWDTIRDTMGDNVYNDLDPLVEGWMERHGCQMTEALKEALEKQVPEEDDEDDEEWEEEEEEEEEEETDEKEVNKC